jgi:exopolyphosphatase/guanosine-5'-triphosphate,3'-diphosphate pyrophosphatase
LVKLGDNKIKANEISPEATQRTVDAFEVHKNIIQKYDVEKVRVIATSAIRSAENKISFLEKLGEESGWIVKIVSGEKEAELIFKGVMLAFKNIEEPSLILDIGGGSNELILTHKNKLLWKESRPTGMARIINQFEISDPVHSREITEIQSYFAEQHKAAIEKCCKKNIKSLIGCSGAFDTIADMIDQVNPGEKQRITQKISIKQFYTIYQKLIKSTRKERLAMKGMDWIRVDLIVPAVILIEQIVAKIGIKKINQTDFALREGVLYELLQSN